MANRPLPYGRQLIEEDDIAAVVEQLRGDWLTQGPAVERFEKELCGLTGAKYCVAVANGTAALHLASLAAGVGSGTTGVTADITFVASANGIRYCGGEPHLVDVDEDTALISVTKLADKVKALATAGRAPKVLVPVDFAGTPADLPAIRAIADEVGALVIEDAAHSLGATYTHQGTSYRAASGVHAHMAILSFHPVKHLTTGEGGAITTNDESLFRELMDLRTHGITKDPQKLEKNDGPWYYEQRTLGFNYRITDIQCALGASQARKFPRFLERRRKLARMYDEAFAAPEWSHRVRPLVVPSGRESAYHLYVVRVPPARRKALFLRLREEQIFTQVHYIPVHSQPDFRAHGLSGGDFKNATAYYDSCISLPLFPGMADGDVERVVDAIRRAF